MHDLNSRLANLKITFEANRKEAAAVLAEAQRDLDWVESHKSTNEAKSIATQQVVKAKAVVDRWASHVLAATEGYVFLGKADQRDHKFMSENRELIRDAYATNRVRFEPEAPIKAPEPTIELPASAFERAEQAIGAALAPHEYTREMVRQFNWQKLYPQLVAHLKAGTAICVSGRGEEVEPLGKVQPPARFMPERGRV